jgi:CO/xanthine dehydrogenase Mo-binding subunit
VAWVEASGRAQFWANSKMPFQLRTSIARGIGLPPEQVCINPALIGGDFGGKGGFMDTHVAYWLARTSGRPVRMTMSYAEELQAGNPRHPAVMIFRTGVRRDGSFVARHAQLYFDGGASAAFRPGRGVGYGPRCLGPYRMDHARIDSKMVYTNHVPGGSMRSPGDPQTCFAGEAQIDLIARALGIDPVELRMRNLVREGDEAPLGQRWKNPMAQRVLAECARVAATRPLRPSRPGLKVGRGFAICERPVGGGRSIARVRVGSDGAVSLAIALRDTGSGFYTMLRQVVGRELGVRHDSIALETLSTDEQSPDAGVGGARVTNSAGNAAREAAIAVREQLCALAADHLGWSPEQIRFEAGSAVLEGRDPVRLGDLIARAGRAQLEAEHVHDAKSGESTVFAVQAADVEVDEETGQVTITRVTSAHDVGQILSPIAHQGQIEGGLLQGLGQAVMEELVWDDGRVANASLGEYKMPTMADIPELETVLVQSEAAGPAPYGGKAIGEHSVSTVAPAVHNAVLDAVGVSIPDLPITAEKVYRALRS